MDKSDNVPIKDRSESSPLRGVVFFFEGLVGKAHIEGSKGEVLIDLRHYCTFSVNRFGPGFFWIPSNGVDKRSLVGSPIIMRVKSTEGGFFASFWGLYEEYLKIRDR